MAVTIKTERKHQVDDVQHTFLYLEFHGQCLLELANLDKAQGNLDQAENTCAQWLPQNKCHPKWTEIKKKKLI